MAETQLIVCTTCRRAAGGAPAAKAPWPGTRMLEALETRELPEGVTLRPAQCLAACAKGCAVALSGGPEKWTYVYGGLDPAQHADALLDLATLYAGTAEGIVPWFDAPADVRARAVARIPPRG
ncbi:conserved hypothetical protein [uncultured Alphaproteobacteria bacterium]|uniref:Metal-binding protein n=1 Tax=uncultured Alphaproteobacteria bacterium TaxID=91750 RepID=A0A212K920_9PROT|nr:conserved hypothetical protein [uncultured Alphaproteobacteria bacterium]